MRMFDNINTDNLITRDDFLGTSRRCHYNEFIGDFYQRFANESQMPIGFSPDTGEVKYGADPNFVRRGKRVKDCCKNWTFDFYRKSGYKNLIRLDRCSDRFCLNCQALAADRRFAQYGPVLDSYATDYDLYHVVLTVPNVDSYRLSDTIELMIDRFAYMIEFFSGHKKVRGVDFLKYGYAGAVRAQEITVSKRDGTYHPHFHCIFIFKKGLDVPKVYWNSFSEDRTGRQPTRLFSELDLIFQRLWCLLIMRKEVTKANIENIGEVLPRYPNGFSCVADLTNGDYHEVFKYAIKGSFKNETLFDYEVFKTLYIALFGKRSYQTYGVLGRYDFNDFDEDLGMASPDEVFEAFLRRLQQSEMPKRVAELLSDILALWDEDECKYISKATFLRHFKSLTAEEKRETLEKIMEIEDV